MKKTQFIDLIKIIKSTFVSFFSVTLFVTLGVGVFLGMSWGGRGLAMSIAKAQDDNNFRDLEIISPYGFTDDDMRELRKVEGVADVEGTYTSYAYFYQGDIKLQAKICTVPEDINKLFSFEGSMPSKPNEIIVEKFWADARNIKIGDTITFLHDAGDHPHALSLLLENEDKFKDPEALLKVFEEDRLCFLIINTEWLYVSPKYFGDSIEKKVERHLKIYEKCKLCAPMVKDLCDIIKKEYPDYMLQVAMDTDFSGYNILN